MDQDSVKLGLLIEAAQAHQKLAEAAIEKLNNQSQDLEPLLTDQIQRALGVALKTLSAETQSAVEALRNVSRAANPRAVLWALGSTGSAAAVALFVAWWVLPTRSQIAALRNERDELVNNIATLSQRGGRADLRRCGTGHLCVRVDLEAPRYGQRSDYLVVKGY